jgi:hypothetical protein
VEGRGVGGDSGQRPVAYSVIGPTEGKTDEVRIHLSLPEPREVRLGTDVRWVSVFVSFANDGLVWLARLAKRFGGYLRYFGINMPRTSPNEKTAW